VERQYNAGRYWPEPLIQINPNYKKETTVQALVAEKILHPRCADVFRIGKIEGNPHDLTLYTHQLTAIAKAQNGQSYVVTTGTGSGKSLSFFIPVIDRILKEKDRAAHDAHPRTRAIVIYPMNALANSQLEELNKFLHGYAPTVRPFSVACYTGQESATDRDAIAENAPDILLTNFMMLELILTRYDERDRRVLANCEGLAFLILDELHTYRGRQGADVALLVRRLRERLNATKLVCIGTSATMSSTGTREDQNNTVADIATKLFATEPALTAHDVIGETLERITDTSKDIAIIRPQLAQALKRPELIWGDFDEFIRDPLAIWVELNLGIELPCPNGAPRRAKPITLSQAAKILAEDAGCQIDLAQQGLQRFLLAAQSTVQTPDGRSPFAFKLHQFISGPGKVHTTLEPIGTRHVTLDAQRFAPGRQAEGVRLYPAHFCRECGQEYHPVWREVKNGVRYLPREIDDVSADNDPDSIAQDAEQTRFGFLCPQRAGQQYAGQLEDLPENWLDLNRTKPDAEPKVKREYKQAVPNLQSVDAQGRQGGGLPFWHIPGKFRFCLNCLFIHEAHGKDIHRLSSLSGEGRSSATTMLTISALRQLFAQTELPENVPDPRKLLGFTDNRQDAALQAGHFNDFVFLLTLRAGLLAALQNHDGVLQEEQVTDAVFKALNFNSLDHTVLAEYMRNPNLRGPAKQDAQKTLRFVLGYRLLRDLRKGWRFNNPNLDQLELLTIDYRDLDEFCRDESAFGATNSVLGRIGVAGRLRFCRLVFDHMRRALCLDSRYLDPVEQDKAVGNTRNYLNERWSFDANETLATSQYLVLAKPAQDKGNKRQYRSNLVSGGPRSGLLRVLKRDKLWRETPFSADVKGWKEQELCKVLEALLKAATQYGYIHSTSIETDVIGWQLNAAVLDWRLSTQIVENRPKFNPFFRQLYLMIAETLKQPQHPLFDFEAHEHTAQVDASKRQYLEQRFRYTKKDRDAWDADPTHAAPLARLSVMFCSPTMELGVDISALNTVYLRNVPPTPANYAQRSGRAGRSGQQALVLTYCAALSPHDQWFFNHKNEMVHGVVRAPTLDLANRDLLDSHLRAVWLANTEVELNPSIMPLLDLAQDAKPVQAALMAKISAPDVLQRARFAAKRVMTQLGDALKDSTWYDENYVDTIINDSPKAFSQALERWRTLHEATLRQMEMADSIVKSHTHSNHERENARRRYHDTARQLELLLKKGNGKNSDFYTYRFLASQGFLPGYNFPRLPLMAWIPARGNANASGQEDAGSMVSRPRFLALAEFGPRSLIYHEGRMYRVKRAKLNVSSAEHLSGANTLGTISARICSQCGYGHLGDSQGGEPLANCCESCGTLLGKDDWVNHLYRIETVETVQEERISINDEERQRQGFELQTTYRFLSGPNGMEQKQDAAVIVGQETLAKLTYSPAAQIWRINRGWRRRTDKGQLGFYINPITGTWSKDNSPDETDTSKEEAPSDKIRNQLIVPFVEDHRNILILTPEHPLPLSAMATLQAALKRGIERTFQIEESELIVEPLPRDDNRQALMFYEAAEGGAGVLTRLASEPGSLAQVANAALEVMHFTRPETGWSGATLAQAEQRDTHGYAICEAGCYQCLLSYFNQPDHEHIDRSNEAVRQLLVALANANVAGKPAGQPGLNSGMEIRQTQASATPMLQQWLAALAKNQLQTPDALEYPINNATLIAAAQYKSARTLIFLHAITDQQHAMLQDRGWQALDFSDSSQWPSLFAQHGAVFGQNETIQ
jgi:Lhr-like helicase